MEGAVSASRASASAGAASASASAAASSEELRVVTWNVLADAYTMGKPHFRYCAEEFLCWSHRSPKLLKILKKSKADVICLQEVQNYEYFWEPEMAMLGYEGAFTPRTQVLGHAWEDGIATFVLSSKYTLDHITPVQYNDLAKGNMMSPHQGGLMTDNVGQILQIRAKNTDTSFIVANTHLHFTLKHHQTKALQASYLVNKVAKKACNASARPSNGKGAPLPVIICGDFNDTPQSMSYKLLTEDDKLRSQLALSSAYKECSNADPKSEPPFTCFTPKFQDTLDYIWYTPSNLVAMGVQPLPKETLIRKNRALPSKVWPSDHLILRCNFGFIPEPSTLAAPQKRSAISNSADVQEGHIKKARVE